MKYFFVKFKKGVKLSNRHTIPNCTVIAIDQDHAKARASVLMNCRPVDLKAKKSK